MGANQSKTHRVAVLGGGPAGLTTAYCLLNNASDVHVDVFEATDRFGGSVLSPTFQGLRYDLGPSSMALKHIHVYKLLFDNLKLADKVEIRHAPRRFFLVKHHKPVLAPTSVPSILSTSLLSIPAKLRFLAEPLIPKLSDERANQESVRAFFRRRFGKAVSDNFVDPMVAGIYSVAPQNLSMKHALRRIWDIERKKRSVIWGFLQSAFKNPKHLAQSGVSAKQLQESINFTNGMETVTESLVLAIQSNSNNRHRLRSNSAVRKLDRDSNGKWKVNGHGPYDAVVSTVPAYALPSISSNVPLVKKTFSRLSKHIPYAPISVMVFQYHREEVPKQFHGFGALVPSKEGLNVLGVNFTSEGFPKRFSNENHVSWTIYAGGGRRPQFVHLSKQQIIDICSKEVQTVFGVKGVPTVVAFKNWYNGVPAYKPGYDNVARYMTRLENSTDCEGLVLGGNYRDGVGLPDALLSGMQCADKVLKRLYSTGSTTL